MLTLYDPIIHTVLFTSKTLTIIYSKIKVIINGLKTKNIKIF